MDGPAGEELAAHVTAIRELVAAAEAAEQQGGALRHELRRAIAARRGEDWPALDAGVEERYQRLVELIDRVPDRVAALVAGSQSDETRRVIQLVRAYWVLRDDVLPDALGLLGRIDDAAVSHMLVARVAKREGVPFSDDPAGALREMLAADFDLVIESTCNALWDGTFRPNEVTPYDVSLGVFDRVEPELSMAEPPEHQSEGVLPETEGPAPTGAEPTPTGAEPAPTGAEPGADDEPADNGVCTVWYGTNRSPVAGNPSIGFGKDRDPEGRVHYGTCEVTVPKTHKFGSIGTPWWKRWARLEFADDHLKVKRRIPIDEEGEFFAQLREDLEKSDGHNLLFYLHGYNVTFDEAAIRAAQLMADLKVDGDVAFFSWPSTGTTKGYPADKERIAESEGAIADFLTKLATQLGDTTVHIIAHSMGNLGLARAIQRITSAAAARADVRFGQIILAAPDVSVPLFKELAAVYPSISQRTTMYVSARDRALDLSSWLQDGPRAGFTPPVTVVPQIDTIEVTAIDVTVLGHGYYADAAPVLYDIGELLRTGTEPGKRQRLMADPTSAYWVIGA